MARVWPAYRDALKAAGVTALACEYGRLLSRDGCRAELHVDASTALRFRELSRASMALNADDASILDGPLPPLGTATFCGRPVVEGADETHWHVPARPEWPPNMGVPPALLDFGPRAET